MTTAAPELVSLGSPWAHQTPQFLDELWGETKKTSEPKFSNSPLAGEKNVLGCWPDAGFFPPAKGQLHWSHWSHGLTPIFEGKSRCSRDQLSPSEPKTPNEVGS